MFFLLWRITFLTLFLLIFIYNNRNIGSTTKLVCQRMNIKITKNEKIGLIVPKKN